MSNLITCKKCGRTLPDSHYYERRETGSIKQPCKSCVAKRANEYRKKNSEWIAVRNREWARKIRSHLRKQHLEYRMTPNGAWTQFQSHKRNGKHELNITRTEFIAWYSEQPQVYNYCGLNAEEASMLLLMLTGNPRRYRLQVDRRDSQKPYELDNLVLACKICNEHKKDVFTDKEFREIAQKYLGHVLLGRLRNSEQVAGGNGGQAAVPQL